jgi:hypothetical protein
MYSVFFVSTSNMYVEAFVGYIFEAEQPIWYFSQNMIPTSTWFLNQFPSWFCTITYKLHYILVLNPLKKTDLIPERLLF